MTRLVIMKWKLTNKGKIELSFQFWHIGEDDSTGSVYTQHTLSAGWGALFCILSPIAVSLGVKQVATFANHSYAVSDSVPAVVLFIQAH